jgi:hypothetical protein
MFTVRKRRDRGIHNEETEDTEGQTERNEPQRTQRGRGWVERGQREGEEK